MDAEGLTSAINLSPPLAASWHFSLLQGNLTGTLCTTTDSRATDLLVTQTSSARARYRDVRTQVLSRRRDVTSVGTSSASQPPGRATEGSCQSTRSPPHPHPLHLHASSAVQDEGATSHLARACLSCSRRSPGVRRTCIAREQDNKRARIASIKITSPC